MKKLNINTIWMSIILLITTCLQSMESPAQTVLQVDDTHLLPMQLMDLPPEILHHVISYGHQTYNFESLTNTIKIFMQLSTTCKKFNNLLTSKTIGNICKIYNLINKNTLLKKLKTILFLVSQGGINDGYRLASILVYAGANTTDSDKHLLEKAVGKKDEELIKTLFERGVDPNTTSWVNVPLSHLAHTVKIAQMFINKGVDIHKVDTYGQNVLWRTIRNCYSIELFSFYLNDCKVDATNRSHLYIYEYLPHMLSHIFCYRPSFDNAIEKGKLLLTVIPHMINQLNSKGKTPLDCVQDRLDEELKEVKPWYKEPKWSEIKERIHKDFNRLFTLFREHGGLTAQELKQKETGTLIEKNSL